MSAIPLTKEDCKATQVLTTDSLNTADVNGGPFCALDLVDAKLVAATSLAKETMSEIVVDPWPPFLLAGRTPPVAATA